MQTPEPAQPPQATLVDLLDRVLDRGLLINADIVICLAGVPLIGINLRAALAGMETMTQYGLLREWDSSIRAGAVSKTSSQTSPSEIQGTPGTRSEPVRRRDA